MRTARSASGSPANATVPKPLLRPSGPSATSARVTAPAWRKRSLRSCHWMWNGSWGGGQWGVWLGGGEEGERGEGEKGEKGRRGEGEKGKRVERGKWEGRKRDRRMAG